MALYRVSMTNINGQAAESVEKDQTVCMCMLILLCTLAN